MRIALFAAVFSALAGASIASADDSLPGTYAVSQRTVTVTRANGSTFTAQIQGGAIYGLTAALYGNITIDKGRVVQKNFPDYDMVRMADAPEHEVKFIESGARTGGAGEPGTAPIAAAVGNAIFALTGKRIRELPFRATPLNVT